MSNNISQEIKLRKLMFVEMRWQVEEKVAYKKD